MKRKSLLFLYIQLYTMQKIKLPTVHILVFYTGDRRKVLECCKQAFLACKEICCLIQDMEWLYLKKLVEKEKIEMCEAEKKWEAEGIKKNRTRSEKKELEMYQTMMDK